MPTFDITRPKDIIPLGVDRKGSIPFAVTNLTATTIKARLEVATPVPEERGFFTIEGGNERTMRPNETLNVRALVAAPEGATPGSHKFWLRVTDNDKPDDRYAESQSVEFVVPGNVIKKDEKIKKWWFLIPVGILLLLVGGGVAWYLQSHPKLEDYTKQSVDDAKLSLRQKGLKVKIVPNTAVPNPSEDDKIIAQKLDGKPAPPGERVKSGTEVTLEVAEAFPLIKDHVGQPLKDAELDLSKMEMKINEMMTKIVLSPAEDRIVIKQSIDGRPTIAGQRVKKGTEITLEFQGAMPRLIDSTIGEAKRVLSEKGFMEPTVTTVANNSESLWNKVFAQEPDPGPPAKPGNGVIQLQVYVSPDPVPGGMPNVSSGGKTYCQAVSDLGAVGLSAMEVLLGMSYTQPELNQQVRAQFPLPGTPIRKGAPGVTLTHAGSAIRCSRFTTTVLDARRSSSVKIPQ